MGIKTSKNRTSTNMSMISSSTQLGVPPLPSGSDITNMRSINLPYGFSGSSTDLNYPLANQNGTNGIKGAAISSDGKKMYFVETFSNPNGTYIHQYTLSKAWDVSTAIYDNVKFNYNPGTPAYTGGIESLTFNPTGDKMFLLNQTADVIIEYTLSTAWNVSSASYTRNVSYALGAAISNEAIGLDMKWSTDGTSIYILGNTNKRIYQFTCNTAWTLASGITYTTKSFLWNGAGQFTGGELNATSLFFNGAGTILYIWGSTHAWVMQWSLSTPWDISTATRIAPDAFPMQFNGSITNPGTWFFGNSGTMLYTADGTISVITQFSVPIAYNPNIRVYNQFFTATGSAGQRQIDFFMKPDGTKIITYGSAVSTGPKYYSFTLSTPYDISTMVYDSVVRTLVLAADTGSVSGGLNVYGYNGMFISTDGTKLYRSVTITAGDTIMQYTLSTPWDITTLTYDNINMGITPDSYIPEQTNGKFCFSSDGVYFFVLLCVVSSSMLPGSLTGQRIRRYTLTTPWDISSRTNPISTDMMSKIYADPGTGGGLANSNVGSIGGIRFNSNGKTCYIWNSRHYTLYQFILSSPYDLQTAIYAGYKTMHGFVMDLANGRPFSVQIVNGSLYMLTDLNSGANDGNSSYMLQFGLG